MTLKTLLVPLAFAIAFSGSAFAADRYTIEKTEDGYVRLDTQTGEMSICKESGTELVCRAAADERAAMDSEIERLSTRLGVIEKRLTALESSSILQPGDLLPSEEQLDKSFDTMEKFFRRFMEVMRDVEKDATRI